MLRFYTNQELSRRFNVPVARWKRWAREFLPPDPLGGLQSGYARRYSVDDALTVFLAGVLVADLKFGIPEARVILTDLNPWLQHGGIFTESDPRKRTDAIPWSQIVDLSIEIQRRPPDAGRAPGFQYRLRGLLQRSALGESVWQERYVEMRHPDDSLPAERFRGALLRVTDALRYFVDALGVDRRHFAALR